MPYDPRHHSQQAARSLTVLARDLASGEAAHRRAKDTAQTIGHLADLTDVLPRVLANLAIELQQIGADAGPIAAALNESAGTLPALSARLHEAARTARQIRPRT